MKTLRLFVMLSVLMCATQAAFAQTLPEAQVTFPEGVDVVTLPFEYAHGFMVITVGFEDVRPLRMILDTGAPVMLVADTSLTNRMNLDIWTQAQVGGTGDGPSQTVPIAQNVEATVGGLLIEKALMLVGLNVAPLAGLDGVIGGSLLEHVVTEIDWEKQEVRFHDPATYTYAGDGTVLPLTMGTNRHIYTEGAVQVEDGTLVPLTLHVDTGARQPLSLLPGTHASLQRPATLLANTIVGWGSRGIARGDMGRVQQLQLGDYVLENLVTSFREGAPEQEEHGSVGLDVFRQFHTILDYGNQRLILEPNTFFGTAFSFSTTGLYLEPWERGTDALTVVDVVAGSPAEEAGIQPGDVITAVNGQAVALLGMEQGEALMGKPAPNTQLTIQMKRGDEPMEATLHARELI